MYSLSKPTHTYTEKPSTRDEEEGPSETDHTKCKNGFQALTTQANPFISSDPYGEKQTCEAWWETASEPGVLVGGRVQWARKVVDNGG